MFYKKCITISIIVFFVAILFIPNFVQANDNDGIYQALLAGKRIVKDRDFIQEEKPTVYLTFDDGPSSLTEEVLDILKEEHVKGTFFVLGQYVENNKEILNRIVKEGHAIGNHTYTHEYKKVYSSFSVFWEEIQQTEKLIYDITGVRTSLVRTPGGTYKNWDSFYFYYMDQEDYLIYDWNVDSGDSKRRNVSTEEIIQTIKQSILSDKLIVLMHDGTGHVNTVKALPEIIQYYKDLGYQFKTLSEKVEPIIHHSTPTRWDREDEFAAHLQFVRKIPPVLVTNQSDRLRKENNEDLYIKNMLNKQLILEEIIAADSQPINTTVEPSIHSVISLPAVYTWTLTKLLLLLPLSKTFSPFLFFDL